MRIVDLTETICSGMPVYPGDPPVAIKRQASLDKQGYNLHELAISSQVGTHVETQSHVIPGRTLNEEPLDRFIGHAAVVDVPQRRLTVDDLLPKQELIERNEFLLLRSGYRAATVNPGDGSRALIDEDVVRWLVDRGVRLMGIDAFGFDPSADLRSHKALLRADVLIVEGLTNLESVAEEEVWLFVIPLKIEGVEASPCRVFALEADSTSDLHSTQDAH